MIIDTNTGNYHHDIIGTKIEPDVRSYTLGSSDNKNKIEPDVRSYNIGVSDYAKHKIQPWDIWLEYNLNPWDADIIKRVLRMKGERREEYQKIIHVAKERIRQIDEGYK